MDVQKPRRPEVPLLQRTTTSVLLRLLLCAVAVRGGSLYMTVKGVEMPPACLLATRKGPLFSVPRHCAFVCSRSPSCKTFCVLFDGQCDLYTTTLATYYEGVNANTTTIYDECYTSWTKSKRSYLRPTMDVTLHPYPTDTSEIRRPIDGHFCYDYDRYVEVKATSVDNDYPYYVIDFGVSRKVTAIISVISGPGTLKGAIVTLGDSEDYMNNTEIARKTELATGNAGEDEELDLKRKISGRYLTFYRPSSTVSIVIAELLVFP